MADVSPPRRPTSGGSSWPIDVGVAAREALRAAQARCQREGFPLRPVGPAGAHLTLRFLGATDPAHVSALGAALCAVAANQTAFVLHTAAPGVFPNAARTPRGRVSSGSA